MAPLLKDRDATPRVGAEPPDDGAPVVVPDYACETCGAAMQRGQDWCLECGTAAPGRLGAARPGWRAAFTVVALTTLLVVAAVVASYAALTGDAERQAAAPSSGDGAPIAAGAPAVQPPAAPITPGATGPGTVPPAVTPPAVTPPAIVPPPAGTTPGKLGPIVPVTPPPATGNTTVKPPAAPPPPPAGSTTPPPPASTSTNNTNTTPQPQIIDLKSDAASTYDPSKRAGAEFGPAKFAIDKSVKTVWDVTVPVDGKPIAAGLMIDLGKPFDLRALRLRTPTGGFRLEIYGAKSAKETPEDILDKRWEHLTDIRKVEDDKLVSLLKKSDAKIELLLLYVTTPAEPSDPRAAIGDVEIAGTP